MNSNNAKGHSPRPAGMLSRTLLSLLITAVVGFLYFYVALPPLNFQSSEFYSFLGLLCVVYVISMFILSGASLGSSSRSPAINGTAG